MKIAIVSGASEGPSELNSFDNALLEAGIGDVNLIKVSSMLAKDTKIVNLPELEAGSMINCVLSHISSKEKGKIISAAVAVAISDDLGCVVESTTIDKDPEENIENAISMVNYMMNKRKKEIKQLIVEEINHTVDECGSAIASVVYL